MSGWVEVTRGSLVESRHRVRLAVVDASGRLRAQVGEAGLVTFARSAVKPIQALPLVMDDEFERLGLTDPELALCCASHGGEPWHVEGVRSILAKAGVAESLLACGPHAPLHEESARALRASGEEPSAVHNNCSGKHAGMLALAQLNGWPLEGYHLLEHPVQRRMLREVAVWAGVPEDEIPTAVDGCGVVTFGISLRLLAGAFARLGAAAAERRPGPAAVVGAMVRAPEYAAGTGRFCTDVMRVAEGRLVAKSGAEGVYCAAVPEQGLGIALKVEDGGGRAMAPSLMAVLQALNLLHVAEVEALAAHAEPPVLNTRGERVGVVRARLELEREP